MCLGIPMEVVEISTDGASGHASTGGVRRPVRFDLLEEVEVGEYVIIHAGYAIQKLSRQDAMETLSLLAEFLAPADDGAELVEGAGEEAKNE